MPTTKEIVVGAGVTVAAVALGAFALRGQGGGAKARDQHEINYLQGDKVVQVTVPRPTFGKDGLEHNVATTESLIEHEYATHRHDKGPETLQGEALLQAVHATADAKTHKLVANEIYPGQVLNVMVVKPSQAALSLKNLENGN